ncbi:MAG: hypothetical protein PWQ57_2183 [Desulfovibrionales bacterium]|nr:hypothetical protein [Desulfovibrionales bacterium]
MRISADSYLRLGEQALPFEAPSESRQNAPVSATGRVRKTRIGFSLGKLGFEYSSEDYQLNPDASVESDESRSNNRAKTTLAATSFKDALDAEAVRGQMLDALGAPTDDVAEAPLNLSAGSPGALKRRQVMAAYAETLAQPLRHTPRTLLATA